MKFPDRERVIYALNPLTEVVCQVKFPRVLAIDRELPVEFQGALAGAYPFLETRNSITIRVAPAIEPELPPSLMYNFLTPDRTVTLTLASDYVAVRTEKYLRWEDFREHVRRAVDALLSVYSPGVFTRIGLRYVNAIERQPLGLENAAWCDLIRRSLLGILSDSELVGEDVSEHQSVTILKVDDGAVCIRHGLARNVETNAQAYLLDCDFFSETTSNADATDVLRRLDVFNAESGRAFGWCIQDQLHRALKPQPVEHVA